MLACDQVAAAVRPRIAARFPEINPENIEIVDPSANINTKWYLQKEEKSSNYDIYTDGAVYMTKSGTALQDFSYAVFIDRCTFMENNMAVLKPKRIKVIITEEATKNDFLDKDILDQLW